jgi:hypothetical protein
MHRRQFLGTMGAAGAATIGLSSQAIAQAKPCAPETQQSHERGEVIYSNPLASPTDIKGFVMEGQASTSFPNGRLRIENLLSPDLGQKANLVFWCPERFLDNISIRWEFQPFREPGLAMMFFACSGTNGEDVLDSKLKPRAGEYNHYKDGDLRTLHISYFRRRLVTERAFHLVNLRRTPGFKLVGQAPDPLPPFADWPGPYPMEIIKSGNIVIMKMNGMTVLDSRNFEADILDRYTGGNIGFRQMAPLIGEYANFSVARLKTA